MRRLVSALVVLGALAVAAVLGGASTGSKPVLKSYDVEFDNAFGLVEGGELKIGGVTAGITDSFRLRERNGVYRTVLRAKINEPGFDALRADARCDVRQQSLIGEYFVDCEMGKSPKRLAEGALIPVKRTSSTVPPDLINTVMRRPYRERWRLIISELGTGLAGRPQDLNDVIRRAHPALREVTETLAILRRQNTIIRDFFRDADTVSAAVEPFKEDVARWAREAEDTASIQASRSEELSRYWNRLPDFLAELEPTMAELEATATAQIPTLRKLGGAAPELERFLRATRPFARETRGALEPLSEMTDAGRAAISESREEIRELRRLAAWAPRLGKPLRQFLQAVDDRRRSNENDPAARALAPPAPDKTAYKAGQGHTGMEGFWNYVYWQTLGINAHDEVGHILRIVLFGSGNKCAPYMNNPSPDEIKECNSWLGPDQPGVTTPDPTERGASASSSRTGDGGARNGGAERRTTGAPAASKLPEMPKTPPLPDSAGGAPDPQLESNARLLDFLLGP